MKSSVVPAVFFALLAAACSGGSSSTSPLATAPTATPTTESFDGAVDVGGTDFHPFTVTLSGGQVNVTLAAATPPATIYMGVAVGSYDSTANTCTRLSGANVVTQAGSVAQLSGTLTNAGGYCVQVYDAGNQLQPVTYTVTVTHY